MKKYVRFIVLGLVMIAVVSVLAFRQVGVEKRIAGLPASYAGALLEERGPDTVVASGLVEPKSKELKLGFEMNGVIAEVLVKEGDAVEAGQILARLGQNEEKARLEDARSAVLKASADLEMHLAGSRPEERKLAEAKLKRAQVWLDQVQRETERRSLMVQSRSIGREELERSQRDLRVAIHEHDMALNEDILVNELYRKEEIEMARQNLAMAEAQARTAEAMLEKTMLKAPVAGRVLRIFSDPGEPYSILSPSAVLSMGDTSVMNVRAEVDERDVGRVQPGQKAYVTATAFDGRKFQGKVSRIELSMTHKRTRSGDPSEPVDRSVLEVLVTLDAPGPLFSGQRVDVYIDGSAPAQSAPADQAASSTPAE